MINEKSELQYSWAIDPSHSEITFRIRHLMIAHVRGSFKLFDAIIITTGDDFTTADIDLWIDASTIQTNDVKRDAHLIGPDFFDVRKHPQLSFKSSTIGRANNLGVHELWGELIIMGITQNIKLDVKFGGIMKDPSQKEKAGFTMTGKINRNDFGLKWNATLESGGLLLSKEVELYCEVELIKIGQLEPILVLEARKAKKMIY